MADKHAENSLDKDKNEELLLDTDAENETTFASTLMNINNIMLAMSESPTKDGLNQTPIPQLM